MCKRILVMDDDLAILDAIKDILEYCGYDVKAYSRGDRIYEKINEYHPDLILLDVMLADLDGRELCKRIKQKQEIQNIPVILISASHNLSSCLTQQGAPDDFITKPFDMNNLLGKIEQHIAAA